MKTIHIEFMGQMRQVTGTSSEAIELDDSAGLDDLLTTLVARHGKDLETFVRSGDGAIRPSLLIVLNGEQVPSGTAPTLSDGDQLTLMPPIAGG